MKSEISKIRLYLMQGVYGLTFLSLGLQMWPEIIWPSELIQPLEGVAYSFWAAYSLLMVLGVRHPVKMLPLLVLQFVYKSTWVLGVGLPLWSAGQLEPFESALFRACFIGAVLDLFIIPWSYVCRNYVMNLFSRNETAMETDTAN